MTDKPSVNGITDLDNFEDYIEILVDQYDDVYTKHNQRGAMVFEANLSDDIVAILYDNGKVAMDVIDIEDFEKYKLDILRALRKKYGLVFAKCLMMKFISDSAIPIQGAYFDKDGNFDEMTLGDDIDIIITKSKLLVIDGRSPDGWSVRIYTKIEPPEDVPEEDPEYEIEWVNKVYEIVKEKFGKAVAVFVADTLEDEYCVDYYLCGNPW